MFVSLQTIWFWRGAPLDFFHRITFEWTRKRYRECKGAPLLYLLLSRTIKFLEGNGHRVDVMRKSHRGESLNIMRWRGHCRADMPTNQYTLYKLVERICPQKTTNYKAGRQNQPKMVLFHICKQTNLIITHLSSNTTTTTSFYKAPNNTLLKQIYEMDRRGNTRSMNS